MYFLYWKEILIFKKLQQLWFIICDNYETGDSGKVAHSSESGESGYVREYGDSDKTCDSVESDISSEYGESGESCKGLASHRYSKTIGREGIPFDQWEAWISKSRKPNQTIAIPLFLWCIWNQRWVKGNE